MESTLYLLPEGGSGVVEGIAPGGGGRRRLMDLGFTPGAVVSCLFAAPSGDPRAYLVRGAVIALRREDAGAVRLRGQ